MFCFPQHMQMGLTASYSERSQEFTASRERCRRLQCSQPSPAWSQAWKHCLCELPGTHCSSHSQAWRDLFPSTTVLSFTGSGLETYKWAPLLPKPKYQKSYVSSDRELSRSVSLPVQCANPLQLECGGLLFFLIASPVPLHPAARSAWWDLGNRSLKQ